MVWWSQAGQLAESHGSASRRSLRARASLAPLELLRPLLQGQEAPALADAGLAMLTPGQLARVWALARMESHLCGQRRELYVQLIERWVAHGVVPQASAMPRLASHLRRLAKDQCRWEELADNAAFYRDHPRLCAGIRAIYGDRPARPQQVREAVAGYLPR